MTPKIETCMHCGQEKPVGRYVYPVPPEYRGDDPKNTCWLSKGMYRCSDPECVKAVEEAWTVFMLTVEARRDA